MKPVNHSFVLPVSRLQCLQQPLRDIVSVNLEQAAIRAYCNLLPTPYDVIDFANQPSTGVFFMPIDLSEAERATALSTAILNVVMSTSRILLRHNPNMIGDFRAIYKIALDSANTAFPADTPPEQVRVLREAVRLEIQTYQGIIHQFADDSKVRQNQGNIDKKDTH